jgi:TorA maturation chaperone TorD
VNVASAPVRIQRPLAAEEAARADFYALLARLLAAGPDDALLRSLAAADPLPEGANDALAQAWSALSQASSVMDSDAGAIEYDDLFVGVGKASLSVYAGFYSGAMAIDHPRVRLQAELAELGLERRAHPGEPVDHLAALFEIMRILVVGGAGRAPAPLADQKRFFQAWLEPAAPKFFQAVAGCAKANYYRKVAALGAAFMAIETESFELE